MAIKKLLLLSLVLLVSGCAGIRFCNKNESPKTGCKAWDPATTTGTAVR